MSANQRVLKAAIEIITKAGKRDRDLLELAKRLAEALVDADTTINSPWCQRIQFAAIKAGDLPPQGEQAHFDRTDALRESLLAEARAAGLLEEPNDR